MFNLASLYEAGCGVKLDHKLAIKLYTEAKRLNNSDAADRLQNLVELGVV
jgi:TPR repeat protein